MWEWNWSERRIFRRPPPRLSSRVNCNSWKRPRNCGNGDSAPSRTRRNCCPCKMGELRWLATVPRPDIRARLAELAAKGNELQASDIYRIHALIKSARTDQHRTPLKYASSSFPLSPAGSGTRGRQRVSGEKVHGGTLSLAGWSDAAYGDP